MSHQVEQKLDREEGAKVRSGLLESVALRVGGPCLLPMSDVVMKLPLRTLERLPFMTEAIKQLQPNLRFSSYISTP